MSFFWIHWWPSSIQHVSGSQILIYFIPAIKYIQWVTKSLENLLLECFWGMSGYLHKSSGLYRKQTLVIIFFQLEKKNNPINKIL